MDREARYGEASPLSPVAEPSTLAHSHSHASSLHNLEDAIIEEIGEGEEEEEGEGEEEEEGEGQGQGQGAAEGEGSKVGPSVAKTTQQKQELESLPIESGTQDWKRETGGSGEPQESAFAPASIPPRPFRGDSSGKYAPIPWEGYFDESEKVAIPGTENVFHIYKAGTQGPVVLCLHGGGYSGLSFALVASKMKHKVRVISLDMRSHGQSRTSDDSDLSAETLSSDVLAVIDALYGKDPPSIVLIGHSMGGAIAVRVASKRVLPTLAGVVVVDVVEGTALASLVHMQRILSSRQSHFKSIDKAIEWSVKGGGALRNIESARVSVPSTLILDENKDCYVWRTPLHRSEAHWRGWYDGLSESFLSCPVAKLLMLAGTDRLDKSLTIGQMQGKFQMIVIRHSGHAIQEDEPDEFSAVVLGFISRNRIGARGLEIPNVWRQPSKT